MLTLGLKITHDAAIACIEDGELLFCHEVEKIDNGPRYAKMDDPGVVARVLAAEGIAPTDIDIIAVDGWKGGRIFHQSAGVLPVAPYHEWDGPDWPALGTRHSWSGGLPLPGFGSAPYESYTHVAGHVYGAYAASPFAEAGEPAMVITWDGGQQPRVHSVRPDGVTFVGTLHELYGIIYGIMGYYFGPYKNERVWKLDPLQDGPLFGGYEAPGKLMGYIGLGRPNEQLMLELERAYGHIEVGLEFRSERQRLAYNQTGVPEHKLCRAAKEHADRLCLSDADALASIHAFLEGLLVRRATKLPRGSNLIFTGGSALNIKWNSALRDTDHFAEVFVPPFPNDSGSAIGVAVASQAHHFGRIRPLAWSVYSGPRLGSKRLTDGWVAAAMDADTLGEFLAFDPSQVVVALHGRAELGPRALGHRSLLASAASPGMKDFMNLLKRREDFRPVAPICLEEHAPEFFHPGTPDPWMLFDHVMGEDAQRSLPAVRHVDGTARLQTINAQQSPTVAAILNGHYQSGGAPVLCNTSANFNGKGFFPDVASAQEWVMGQAPDVRRRLSVWDGDRATLLRHVA